MKSREEYEASIYKKKDAMLAKRKKNIRITLTALSVIICLTATVFAAPKLMDKAEETPLPSVTNAARANGITEKNIEDGEAVFDEAETELVDYTVTKTQPNDADVISEDSEGEKAEAEAEEIERMTVTNEIYLIPETEIAVEEDGAAGNTAGGIQFGYEAPDALSSEITSSASSKKTYTTEEITAAAQKHIDEDDADKIISGKTNAVMSRNSDGTTSYTVYFYTAEKKITVKLSSVLDLIEITQKDASGGGTTQIAPAYNPNEE